MNLLKENESYGVRFLKQLNVDPEMVARQIGDFAQTCGADLLGARRPRRPDLKRYRAHRSLRNMGAISLKWRVKGK